MINNVNEKYWYNLCTKSKIISPASKEMNEARGTCVLCSYDPILFTASSGTPDVCVTWSIVFQVLVNVLGLDGGA